MYLRSKVVRCEDLVNVRTKLQFHKCLQFFFVFFLVFAPSLPFMGLNSAQSSTQHYQNSPIGINVGFLSSLILISHFACQLVHFLCKSTNLNNLFFFSKTFSCYQSIIFKITLWSVYSSISRIPNL
jgi:hypothetical protein